MQAIHDLDTIAVLNLQHALLFEAFRGLPHDAAADAKLLSQGTLAGEPAIIFWRACPADDFRQLLTD